MDTLDGTEIAAFSAGSTWVFPLRPYFFVAIDPEVKMSAQEITIDLEKTDKSSLPAPGEIFPQGTSLFEMLTMAIAAHERGELDFAEAGYQVVLDKYPGNADALQYSGLIAHQRGDDARAIDLLEQAVKSSPENGTVHSNLGSVCMRSGDVKKAETHFRKALVSNDPPPDALCNLGVMLRSQKRMEEARETLEKAVKKYPDHPKAKRELAEVFVLNENFNKAEPLLRAYLEVDPGNQESRTRLGFTLQKLGRLKEAREYFADGAGAKGENGEIAGSLGVLQRLVAETEPGQELWAATEAYLKAKPEQIAPQIGFGINIVQAGQVELGLKLLHMIADCNASDFRVWNDIGGLLGESGKRESSLTFLHKAAELDPECPEVFNNLGNVYVDIHKPKLAIPYLQRALEIQPDMLEAYLAICRAYRLANEFDKALFYARTALTLPSFAPHQSSTLGLIFRATCDYDSIDELGDLWEYAKDFGPKKLPPLFLGFLAYADTEQDTRNILDLVKRWADHADALVDASPLPPLPPRAARDKLRVGIVSSDLRNHSVARFCLPLIRGFDRDALEFYCYTPYDAKGDHVQKEFRDHATEFRFLDNMTHKEMAETIRADQVDILIELNGFTHGSCLQALAYRPAPVQMTWIGYPFTTGLKAVDYVVMDRYALPDDESILVEEPIIMPEAWLCFESFPDVPITQELPMDRNGYVTFGTLNNPYKITRDVIAAWAGIMNQVPDSRFLIVRPEVASLEMVRNLAREFESHGISSDRLMCYDNRTDNQSHMTGYNNIDISLDTFPITGGTTTCEALWMGVPVVTLVGKNFHQRVSYSMLMQCGLEEFCTFNLDDYAATAVSLAGDRERLLDYRLGLRDRLFRSPLCDGERFSHQFQEMLLQVGALHKLC